MHEMSLCEGVLQVMEDQAKSVGFNRVKIVWLEIGDLAGVDAEAMRFGFDVVVKDTVADGAALEIIKLPGRAWCMACSHEVTVNQRFDPCPDCGGYQLQVTGGDELRIKEMEVE